MRLKPNNSGFTLIELLVVIAIIGLLSSVVLTSVATAKVRARDAAIKSAVGQFEILMALEYSDNRSYGNLQKGWANTPGDCAAIGFAGNYAAKAIAICSDLVTKSDTGYLGNYRLHTGTQAADYTAGYAIMIFVPARQGYYCAGSGGKSDTTSQYVGTAWGEKGCYSNP